MNTKITEMAMTTLAAMSQVPEKFSATEIKNFYENIIAKLPCLVVWKDKDFKYVFCNETIAVDFLKLSSPNEMIGKTDFELGFNLEAAQYLRQVDEDIVKTGKPALSIETTFEMDDGRVVYISTNRMPLFDSSGKVIGILGIGVDITDQKETEKLKLENEAQKATAQEQEKFRKLAGQVAHDIRSPLASLLMLVKICQTIPENERIALREAANNIGDIANNLLNNYQKNEVDPDQTSTIGEHESVLASPLLLQILTDRKYQYQNLAVKFDHHFSQTGNFAWIKIEPIAFKRMLSNLINNSVDAFDQKEGKITLYLDADDKHVRITVEDNGKGMGSELVQKILNRTAVTEGKEDGHGIGLTQVRETLENNQGEWAINSQPDQGTQFVLTFPRTKALNWIAESIHLNDDDTVVILDDDTSIHMAWDIRFDVILKKFPHLKIKHFEIGQEAIDFINDHAPDKKRKIFLLADYELLKQELDGLDVIKQTQIKRSILVTSHYAHKRIQQLAAETATKILPKQLASEIAIKINEAITTPDNELKEVDAIFVDDDQRLLDSFTFFAFNKQVDTYQDPQHFLDNLNRYPKDTKIMLDNHFANFDRKGIQIAEQLHALGFTQLYLLSGESFSGCQIPHYLTAIMKTDLDQVEAILNQ